MKQAISPWQCLAISVEMHCLPIATSPFKRFMSLPIPGKPLGKKIGKLLGMLFGGTGCASSHSVDYKRVIRLSCLIFASRLTD